MTRFIRIESLNHEEVTVTHLGEARAAVRAALSREEPSRRAAVGGAAPPIVRRSTEGARRGPATAEAARPLFLRPAEHCSDSGSDAPNSDPARSAAAAQATTQCAGYSAAEAAAEAQRAGAAPGAAAASATEVGFSNKHDTYEVLALREQSP